MQGKDKPFFTVIVPIYNKKVHLARCFHSIFNQTFQSFEVLAIDDASTDDSLDFLNSLEDSRLQVLQREAPGPGGYKARNLGISKANAKWVVFLDADDEWMPDHLHHYWRQIQKSPTVSLLSSGWLNNFGNNKVTENSYHSEVAKSKGTHFISVEDFLRLEVEGERCIWTSVACVKQELLISAGLFPEHKDNRGGDVDTWLRCLAISKKALYSCHVGAIYHRDSINMVTKSAWSDARGQLETVKDILSDPYLDISPSLLKKYYNIRLIAAWKINKKNGLKGINLLTGLFLRNGILRNLKWITLSIFK